MVQREDVNGHGLCGFGSAFLDILYDDFTFHCIEAFSRRLVASLEELAFGGFIHFQGFELVPYMSTTW